MRIDLHNHTAYSPDSRVSPRETVAMARRRGLQGVAITDHNSIGGIAEAEDAADSEFLVIPGLEVSSRDGHILAYGIREIVPRDRSPTETVEEIVARGGVAVAAHPYRFWSGLGELGLRQARFLAYETLNARTLRGGNARADRMAGEQGLGRTGGSDSHFLDEIGAASTVFDSNLSSVDAVLEAIARAATKAEGRSRGAAVTGRYVAKSVSEWMVRGFRRI